MSELLGYMRVSTSEQDIEPQRQRLIEAKVTKNFHDIISGRNFNRPGLKSLFDYSRPGDILVIVRLDRLGRSLKELLETVELLKQKGIQLMSLEEKIDTSSAAGELVFHIFGSIAHFERRLISERTKDGLKAAELRGRHPGRPALCQEKKEAALALIESGLSPSVVAKQLCIGRSTLYREISRAVEILY